VDHRSTAPADLPAFDLILGTAGGSGLAAWRRPLTPAGRMVTIAPTSPSAVAAVVASGVHGPRRMRFFSGNPRRRDLRILAAHVERGDVRPLIAGVHELADIAGAHAALERGGSVGKHVVRVRRDDS
jgi:NADPH:quinone reductase-like Zn-dependent oxidoreductase